MDNENVRKRKNSREENEIVLVEDNGGNNETQPPQKQLKLSQSDNAVESNELHTRNAEINTLDSSSENLENINNKDICNVSQHTTSEADSTTTNNDTSVTSASLNCSNDDLLESTNDMKEEMITIEHVERHVKEERSDADILLDEVEAEANDKKIDVKIKKEEIAIKDELIQDDLHQIIEEPDTINKREIVVNEVDENINANAAINSNDVVQKGTGHLKDVVTIKFGSKYVSSILKEDIRNALMKVKDVMIFEKNNDLIVAPVANTKRKRKRSEKTSKNNLFMVDTTPSLSQEKLQLRYSCRFSLDNSEKIDNERKIESIPTCYNCDRQHNLRDCPYPKDFIKINKAKMKTSKSVRYHLEEEQKFHNIKPGKFSQQFKEALGLRCHELPTFIYRMREMGYPPGWVEEAFETNSDIALFDSEGKLLNSMKKEVRINPEKIVEFPGFNAPLEKYVDEYRNYGTVKYSKHVNKQSILDVIKKFKDNHETCDMDIAEDDDIPVQESQGKEKIDDRRNDRLSPTLNDLEKEKIKLLAQLDASESSNDKEDDVSKTAITVKDEKKKLIIGDMSNGNNRTTVKTSSFGTPILDRKYPYKNLPHPDNFSVNISPVINFENLPNSTGKFEQMIGILQKVRATLKSNVNNTKL